MPTYKWLVLVSKYKHDKCEWIECKKIKGFSVLLDGWIGSTKKNRKFYVHVRDDNKALCIEFIDKKVSSSYILEWIEIK